jgi:hypothetical protein
MPSAVFLPVELPTLERPPTLTVERASAKISVRTDDQLFGNSLVAGPWIVTRNGNSFMVRQTLTSVDRLQGSPDQGSIFAPPERIRWTVKVHFQGTRILTASPVPQRDDGEGNLTWKKQKPKRNVKEAATLSTVQVTGRLPLPRFLATSSFDPFWNLVQLENAIVYLLVFFLAAGLVLRRGRRFAAGPTGGTADTGVHLVFVALLAVASVAAIAAINFLNRRPNLVPASLASSASLIRGSIIRGSIVLAVSLLMYVFSIWILKRPVSRLGWFLLIVVGVAAFVGISQWGHTLALPRDPTLPVPLDPGDPGHAPVGLKVLAIVLGPLLVMTFLFQGTLSSVAIWIWPRASGTGSKPADAATAGQRAASWATRSRWPRRIVNAAIVVLASVTVLATFAAYDLRMYSWRSGASFWRRIFSSKMPELFRDSVLVYPVNLMYSIIYVLPTLLLLAAMVILLHSLRTESSVFFGFDMSPPTPDPRRRRRFAAVRGRFRTGTAERASRSVEMTMLCLIFSTFVVGASESYLGLAVPISFFLSLGLLRFAALHDRLQRVEVEAAERNNSKLKRGSVLTTRRRELLRRTDELLRIRRRRAQLYNDFVSGKLNSPDYQAGSEELDRTEIELRTGEPGAILAGGADAGDSQEVRERETPLLRLPDTLDGGDIRVNPRDLALALGPGANWWDNGVLALKRGALLAIPFIGYTVYAASKAAGSTWFTAEYGFRYWQLVVVIASAVRFWLVSAFVMGCLYPYLRGSNGVAKGVVLASVYIIAGAVDGMIGMLLHVPDSGLEALFPVQSWLLLLFLTSVGALMDSETLRRYNVYWRGLYDFYQLGNIRSLLVYLAPLLVAALGIVQQIRSGQAQEAVTQLIKTLPQTIPGR